MCLRLGCYLAIVGEGSDVEDIPGRIEPRKWYHSNRLSRPN